MDFFSLVGWLGMDGMVQYHTSLYIDDDGTYLTGDSLVHDNWELFNNSTWCIIRTAKLIFTDFQIFL